MDQANDYRGGSRIFMGEGRKRLICAHTQIYEHETRSPLWPSSTFRGCDALYGAAWSCPLSILIRKCGGGCEIFDTDFTGSAASTICAPSKSRQFYQFGKICKTVARRHVVGGIAQSPHGLRLRLIRAEELRRLTAFLHWHCTISVQSLHSLSVRIVTPESSPFEAPDEEICTMPVDNVNYII